MKILAILPARYASTRLPGKPLADIHGKPMIQWVYEGVSGCVRIDDVIVATDDQRIVDAVVAFGGKAEMTDASHINGTSRCAEVSQRYPEYDYILNVQGDEPLINPKHLEALIGLFGPGMQIATACKKLTDEASIEDSAQVKLVKNIKNEALYFSRSVIPFNRDNGPIDYYGHIGLYGFHRDTLAKISALEPTQLELAESLEQLRWMENGYRISVCEVDEPAPSVDTQEGLEKVRRILGERLNQQ